MLTFNPYIPSSTVLVPLHHYYTCMINLLAEAQARCVLTRVFQQRNAGRVQQPLSSRSLTRTFVVSKSRGQRGNRESGEDGEKEEVEGGE